MQVAATVELSEREHAFVQALTSGARPTRAARDAGYSIGHARALLAKPHIRAALLAVAGNARAILSEGQR